ncbi:MAG: 50S ribosomal protein L32 [Ruminococcaceae bacterium]|nr:50S ribosomal protein L32 [Oscillospiraceae bacterium]
MAVPKRRVSKTRRDTRRSSVWKLEPTTIVQCPNCKEYILPHRVCKACGKYKGIEVIKQEEAK